MEQFCPHCNLHPLVNERELYSKCCYVCRRYGLLLGRWLESSEAMQMMISEMTDAQVAQLLELCSKVAAIQRELPPTPPGFGQKENVKLEVAKNLRDRLAAQNGDLMALAALLR